jgi:universal stress protein A
MKLRHILVPIDFSQTSHRALDFAIPLASQFDARISLLHVIEPIIYPQEIGPIAVSEMRLAESALKELRTLAQKTVPAANLNKVLTRTGLPYREITDAARQLKADLIVLTTHGHTGFTRVLLGSTAERIVRHARCPVLTVRQ